MGFFTSGLFMASYQPADLALRVVMKVRGYTAEQAQAYIDSCIEYDCEFDDDIEQGFNLVWEQSA